MTSSHSQTRRHKIKVNVVLLFEVHTSRSVTMWFPCSICISPQNTHFIFAIYLSSFFCISLTFGIVLNKTLMGTIICFHMADRLIERQSPACCETVLAYMYCETVLAYMYCETVLAYMYCETVHAGMETHKQTMFKPNSQMSPVQRICVFEHSVMTNFNCACPAIQRAQRSGFLSEGSS